MSKNNERYLRVIKTRIRKGTVVSLETYKLLLESKDVNKNDKKAFGKKLIENIKMASKIKEDEIKEAMKDI